MGVTLYTKRRVYINVRYPRESFYGTTLHELNHVSQECLHLPYWMAEAVVGGSEDQLAGMLQQLGFRLPDLPDGWEAMRDRFSKRKRKR